MKILNLNNLTVIHTSEEFCKWDNVESAWYNVHSTNRTKYEILLLNIFIGFIIPKWYLKPHYTLTVI